MEAINNGIAFWSFRHSLHFACSLDALIRVYRRILWLLLIVLMLLLLFLLSEHEQEPEQVVQECEQTEAEKSDVGLESSLRSV